MVSINPGQRTSELSLCLWVIGKAHLIWGFSCFPLPWCSPQPFRSPKRPPLKHPGAQISKSPSALSNSIFKTEKKNRPLVCESSGKFKCLGQKATVLAWDRRLQYWLGTSWFHLEIDDFNGIPDSSQGGAEKVREGKVYMMGSDHSGVWKGRTAQSGRAKLGISAS